MGIGIVGSGKICATAARIFAEAGHEVTVSNSRGRESLASLVEEVGPRARAATVEEAADFGEAVLEAISRLVKAFNTMYYVRLHTEGRRRGGEGRRLAAHRGDRVR